MSVACGRRVESEGRTRAYLRAYTQSNSVSQSVASGGGGGRRSSTSTPIASAQGASTSAPNLSSSQPPCHAAADVRVSIQTTRLQQKDSGRIVELARTTSGVGTSSTRWRCFYQTGPTTPPSAAHRTSSSSDHHRVCSTSGGLSLRVNIEY